jgi:hypothetical protein
VPGQRRQDVLHGIGREVIGWVGQNQIHRIRSAGGQDRRHRAAAHRRTGQSDGADVAGDHLGGTPVAVDEQDRGRPARQRLQPQRPGAGEQVQHPQPVEIQTGGQDVEQRFPHPVGGRPGTRRHGQPAATGHTGDDPGHRLDRSGHGRQINVDQ